MTIYAKRLTNFCLLLFLVFIVACQADEDVIQATIENELAQVVSATISAHPTQTAYATQTTYPTQIPFSTSTPYATQQLLETATYYPTATAYPTHTPLPANTETPIPPTNPPSAVNSQTIANTETSPLNKQTALLEQMNLQHSLLSEFQGLVNTLQDNPDCYRIIELYNGVANLPEMDVSGTDESVQQAHTAYRTAIDHFTKPETLPGDIVLECQTQPDNVKNIPQDRLNLIGLYVGQSIARMHEAWYDIGGR